MQPKSYLAGAAIALAATIGSASAADQFTTISGFEAQAMTEQEMEGVRGAEFKLTVAITTTKFRELNPVDEQPVGANGFSSGGLSHTADAIQSAVFLTIEDLPNP